MEIERKWLINTIPSDLEQYPHHIIEQGYLNTADEDEVAIDYGSSQLYSDEDLKEAVIQIKCEFAFWPECKLESIRYAGDEAVTDKNLKWLKEVSGNDKLTQIAEFFMDFHTPKNTGDTSFESDKDYKHYQWWVAKTEDDGWEIVSKGY